MRVGWSALGGMLILLGSCRGRSDAEQTDGTSTVQSDTADAGLEHDSGDPGAPAAGVGGRRPPRVRGDHAPQGRLARETIEPVVAGHLAALRSCYAQGLRNDPMLEGQLTVRFLIARNGAMTSASVGGDVVSTPVRKCVRDAFYRMSFPEPQGGLVTATCVLVMRHLEGPASVTIEWPSSDGDEP
jgi:hypothetical protein